jgi:hypothetical protein
MYARIELSCACVIRPIGPPCRRCFEAAVTMYAGAKDVRSSPFSRVGAIATASCEIIVEAFVVKGTTMTFGCPSAKRSVSPTITHGRVLFASLGSPSPRQSNTHTSPASVLAICVFGNVIPEVVKLLCVRVVAVVLGHTSRLCANVGLSNELRAVRREISKIRCKTDAMLLGISLKRRTNFIVEPDGNGSSHNHSVLRQCITVKDYGSNAIRP